MAQLRSVDSDHGYTLASRTIVGRSSSCHIRLSGLEVSAIHAEMAWEGDRWCVADLGSRNGTYVDGELLAPGQRVALEEGSVVGFGTARKPYVLTDASPPCAMAVSADGRVILAESGILTLPDASDPVATIFRRPDGAWAIDTNGVVATTNDQAMIVVHGSGWRLFLPEELDLTRDAGPPRLSQMRVRVKVSRDHETITVEFLRPAGDITTLVPRSHSALILALAKARITDKQSELARTEHGWMHREQLVKDLQIDFELLNVWVHRARQQAARAGVPGAASIVERRPGTGQLRLGVHDVEIEYA